MLLAVAAVPGTVWPQRAQSPEKVVAVPRRTTRRSGPWLDRLGVLRRVLVGLVLARSTCCCSSRWSAASCRAPRCTSRASAAARRARPAGSTRFPAQGSGLVRRRAAAGRRATPTAVLRRGWRWLPFVPDLPRRHARRGRRHVVGVGGARLPARDRQPRLPPRPRRPAHLRGHRPGAALPRAGDRRAGPRVRQLAGRLRHVRAAAPRSRRRASSRSRCALDDFESRFDPETLAVARLHRARHPDRARARSPSAEDHQGQPPARRGRRQGLPAGQRLRARHHGPRRLRAGRVRAARRRSCRRTRSTRRAASSRCPTSPATRSRSASSATCCRRVDGADADRARLRLAVNPQPNDPVARARPSGRATSASTPASRRTCTSSTRRG